MKNEKDEGTMNAMEFYADTMRKHLKIMILQFAQQEYMQKLGFEKDISEERRYEIVVSLLAKGALVAVALGDQKWTIRPLVHNDEWVEAPEFLKLSGTYKEIKEITNKIKENKDE